MRTNNELFNINNNGGVQAYFTGGYPGEYLDLESFCYSTWYEDKGIAGVVSSNERAQTASRDDRRAPQLAPSHQSGTRAPRRTEGVGRKGTDC